MVPPVVSAAPSPRADRRRNDDRILRAAAGLLSRDPGVTVRAIADAAGVARPTVYRRYADRDALVTALRAAIDAELDQALDAVPGWTEDADVIGDLVGALVGVAVRYPVARLRYAPVVAAPPRADARVIAVLRAGQHRGRLRDDVTAETMHAALFGVLSAVLDGPAQNPDEAAATVLTLIASGIRPSPPTRPSGDRP